MHFLALHYKYYRTKKKKHWVRANYTNVMKKGGKTYQNHRERQVADFDQHKTAKKQRNNQTKPIEPLSHSTFKRRQGELTNATS
jgi:hypothetical protein